MAQAPITVGDTTISAGERRYVNLPLPHLYTHAQITMPVYVMHGRQEGSRLFISAAIHGDEINGVEIIRRLLDSRALKNLRGTLLAVPVVNVFGFLDKSRYLPDRRDLNRSFPGSEHGSLASQVAHQFLNEIASRCTHGIDLHTAAAGRTNMPQIRAYFGNDGELQAMAQAFNAPIVLSTGLRDGSLRKAASERGVKVLLYEAGEALRFGEVSIQTGVKGILSVMRHLGMLPAQRKQAARVPSVVSHSSTWVRAPQSGILRVAAQIGNHVNKGDVLGYVADPFGSREEVVRTPLSGILIGRNTLPLVHEGEGIFHLAEINGDQDSSSLKPYHHEMEPDTEGQAR